METDHLSIKAKAVLAEIKEALARFEETGEIWTIFIDKMALSFEERQSIRNFLGEGAVSIKFNDAAEPVEWLESGFPGIWYGVFYNNKGNPILETVEIGAYPELAVAQLTDIADSSKKISEKLNKFAL